MKCTGRVGLGLSGEFQLLSSFTGEQYIRGLIGIPI